MMEEEKIKNKKSKKYMIVVFLLILSTFQNKIAIFVLRHFAASKKRG